MTTTPGVDHTVSHLAIDVFRPSPGYRRRRVRGLIAETLCVIAATIAVILFVIVLWYIARRGISALNVDFFTRTPAPVGQPGGGMANAIAGTILIVGLGAAMAIPIGIGAGTYLAEYGHGRLAWLIRLLTDVLTGVPSIVIGILAYELVVVRMSRFSALAGGVALAVIMLPPIVRTSDEILQLVPREYPEAAMALGAQRWRTTVSIVYPAALSGLITGIMLAIARAAGETAPLLFTAFGNTFWNWNPTQPTAALPLQIYQYAISPYEDWQRQAWGGALVLVVLVLVTSGASRWVASRQAVR